MEWEKPRVRLKTLKLPKENGGLPDLTTYYLAAQIKPILVWMNSTAKAKWRQIESSLEPSLNDIISTPKSYWKRGNISLKSTMEAWQKICKIKEIRHDSLYLKEIAMDLDFKASTIGNVFKGWAEKGLHRYYQIITENGVESFENLKTKYDIPNTQFHNYLQIRSYLKERQGSTIMKKNIHPLIKYIAENYDKKHPEHVMRCIYKILQKENIDDKLRPHTKWEEETQMVITTEDWRGLSVNCHKTTSSPFWREFAWKIQMRYFITPKIQGKYDKDSNSLCWRGCGENTTNHTHIFYTCPHITTFWNEVKNTVDRLLDLKLKPEHILLGTLPPELISETDRYLYRILRIAALKQITRNWKQPDLPTTGNWFRTIKEIHTMENITHNIRQQKTLFEKRWAKMDIALLE